MRLLTRPGRWIVARPQAPHGRSCTRLLRWVPSLERLEDRAVPDGAGSLDPSFGTGGQVFSPLSGVADAVGMALQGDGRILVAGASPTSDGSKAIFLVRYTAAGAPDATFGNGLPVPTPVHPVNDTGFTTSHLVASVTVQADGGILVAGSFTLSDNSRAFAVARYTPGGSPDTAFGDGGLVLTTFGGEATCVAVQADGKILVAGRSFQSDDNRFAMARYTAAGALDPDFGGGGEILGGDIDPAGIVVQSDGRIVVAGTVVLGGGSEFAVARYTAAGDPDTSFGNGGEALTDFNGSRSDQAVGLAVQSDGGIVVAGTSAGSTGQMFAVARYTAAGDPDTSFGNGGEALTAFNAARANRAYGMAMQADNRAVVAGVSFQPDGPKFAVARYTTAGAPDTAFGTLGQVLTAFAGKTVSDARSVALQGDGKIVVAGFATSPSGIALARYQGSVLTATTITPSVARSHYGDAVTFTAAVSPVGPAVAPLTGTVTFYDGSSVLYGPTSLGSDGQARISTNLLSAGSHTITARYSGNSSYSGSDGSTSGFRVDPASLTVTADPKSKSYGSPDPALTFSYSGLVNGETVAAFTGGLARAAGEGVGKYDITQGTLQAVGNYTIGTFAPGKLTISPATLAVTADDKSKTYGAPVPSLTYTYSGLVNGDTDAVFSGALTTTATAGSDVGTYPIDQGSLSAGPNYSVLYARGTLSVTPATLTVSANGGVRSYGRPNPPLTASYSGFVNGETLATSGVTGSPTLTTSAAAGSAPGLYLISVGLGTLAASNYNFQLVNGILTVTRAPTSAVVTSSATAVPHDLPVSFSVIVSSGLTPPFTPAGVVQFQLDGQNVGAPVPLSASGTATYGVAGLAAGTHSVAAVYSGNGNFAPSTSPTFFQLVLAPGAVAIGTELFVVSGSTTNDQVQIAAAGASATGSTGVGVTGTLNGVAVAATFNQPLTMLRVFGYGGSDFVQLAGSLTVSAAITLGDGNNTVLAPGNGATTVVAGNGNDNVRLGSGNDSVTLGNGNNNVVLGNGNNVVVTGNGADNILAGNGNNLIAAGLGPHAVLVGNGSNILIDGGVALTREGDSLRQVLNDWVLSGPAAAAGIRSRLKVTYNTTYANVLLAGSGLDWFWVTYPGDVTNRKATDLLN